MIKVNYLLKNMSKYTILYIGEYPMLITNPDRGY